jgi:hypothetical protein
VSNSVFFILQNKMAYYICSPQNEGQLKYGVLGAISSVGLEHLPYKQGVTGSNPVSPTSRSRSEMTGFFIRKNLSFALGLLTQRKTKHS